MARKKKDIKKSILARVRTLYIVFFIIGVAIAGKILYIQYGPEGEELREKAVKITYERTTIPADRGDILSVDGRTLATSLPTYEVRMDFAANGLTDSVFHKNVDSLSYYLAGFFKDKSAAQYKNILTSAYADKSKNRYKLISPRRVDHLEIKEIRKFPLFKLGANRGGFIAAQVNQRKYPHGSLAYRTIGMVNESGTKVGLEGAYDSLLRGTDGNVLMQRISGTFRIPVPDELSVEPVNGYDVVSTIDVDLQDVAETALKKQLLNLKADWGTAILMEVETGEIRAIANLTRKGETVVEDYNYAVGMNLEPGSTFKLASLIALLEDAGASLDEEYDTGNGTMMIGRARVVDTKGYGNLTLREVFAKSSNIGFGLAVNKYYQDNPQKFVDNLIKMGLDKPTGIPISGEPKPIIYNPGDRAWSGVTLTMMSYGYAVRMTPLKTLTLYNAVANKGKMVQPMFVRELQQYGGTVKSYRPVVLVDKIASDKTIKLVDQTLKDVVEEGTGGLLRNPYYSVAAKTGTAQIAQDSRGYTDSRGGRHYLATMAGYFPADNPKYSCIVVMKTYNGPGDYRLFYGAQVPGPVFKAIADRVYARSTDLQVPVSKVNEKAAETPAIKTGHTEEAVRVARRFKVPVETPRGSSWYAETETRVTGDSVVHEIIRIDENSGTVPYVVGMGLKEALYLLEKEGLTVSFSGTGTVRSQSVAAGQPVEKGTLVSLRLGL